MPTPPSSPSPFEHAFVGLIAARAVTAAATLGVFESLVTSGPAAQALFHTARGVIAATPQQAPVNQAPSGPPLPKITGTELPMAG